MRTENLKMLLEQTFNLEGINIENNLRDIYSFYKDHILIYEIEYYHDEFLDEDEEFLDRTTKVYNIFTKVLDYFICVKEKEIIKILKK